MPNLFDLSLLQMLAVYLAGGAIFYIAGALFFDIYAGNVELFQNNDLAGVNMGFFEPLASVAMVMALSLAWIQYGLVVSEIQKETTALTVLAASAKTMPEANRTRLTAAISAYAAAVAGPEWKAMAKEGRGSEVCAEALRMLARTYATTHAETPREQLILRFSGRQLIKLAQSREMRLEGATFQIQAALTDMLVVSLVLAIFTSWFFGLPDMATKLAMGVLFTWSMVLVLVHLTALMHPFSGPVGISNDAYLDIVRSLVPDSP
jgi:hypothetical protein